MTAPGMHGHVLVTGAGGFVGQRLCKTLAAGEKVLRAVRRAVAPGDVAVGDIGPDTDWRSAVEGAACVVHLAARTHILKETGGDALARYRQTNVAGTERVARAAAQAGVRRFVFLSSVKVNGERTAGHPYTESDAPHPEDAYGISKREAELALLRIAQETGLEVAILRPPLVYGPGVKGNFLRLMNAVARGWPLPLASVKNRRSLIHVGNLVDAIITAMDAPQAVGSTYLISDGEDVSTPDLVRGIALAFGRSARLFPCPVALLNAGAALVGKGPELSRLTGSLQVDSSRIRRELGWQPRRSLAQGLAETAQWYHARLAA